MKVKGNMSYDELEKLIEVELNKQTEESEGIYIFEVCKKHYEYLLNKSFLFEWGVKGAFTKTSNGDYIVAVTKIPFLKHTEK